MLDQRDCDDPEEDVHEILQWSRFVAVLRDRYRHCLLRRSSRRDEEAHASSASGGTP